MLIAINIDFVLQLPLLLRDNKQAGPDDTSVSTNSPNVTCMKKVMMVETTEWDYEEKCQHVPGKSCYQTYETQFKPNKVCGAFKEPI